MFSNKTTKMTGSVFQSNRRALILPRSELDLIELQQRRLNELDQKKQELEMSKKAQNEVQNRIDYIRSQTAVSKKVKANMTPTQYKHEVQKQAISDEEDIQIQKLLKENKKKPAQNLLDKLVKKETSKVKVSKIVKDKVKMLEKMEARLDEL